MLSDDGKRVWVCGGMALAVRDLAARRELANFPAFAKWLISPVFSPDGRLVMCGGQRTVIVWAVAGSRERARVEGLSSDVRAVAFTPDGQSMAAATADGVVHLWRAPGAD